MGKVRNRINVKLVNSKKKDYLNVHQNQAICRTKYFTIIWLRYEKKDALKLNKLVYFGMCILELS